MANVKLILSGMDRLAFLASSPIYQYEFFILILNFSIYSMCDVVCIPVDAMESNPTKAKKHFEAPAMTPANP